MRIIAGTHRGRKLAEFDTERIRPTSDMARGALFNALTSLLGTLEDILFVDAFAGTGAVGIEALSRGASAAIFFETDDAALKLIKKNLSELKLHDKALLYGDTLNPPRYTRPADVVFLDPPYNFKLAPHALRALLDNGYIGPHTVIVLETEQGEEIVFPERFSVTRKMNHGRADLHWIAYK